MKNNLLLIFVLITLSNVFSQENRTLNYDELIEVYNNLAKDNEEIQLFNMGASDYGLPIYLCLINAGSDSTTAFESARNSNTLLINNAIHPGEPDGVNACLNWINEWVNNGKKIKNLPVIAIIPAYNVGGMMNRSGTSRANQDGPEEYGFRGNSQNLDLNRDFIKMDSKNMFTFSKIYHSIEPDVFLDTHVSNGADYQYTMTYIASVRERMAPSMVALMDDEMLPFVKKYNQKQGIDITPYVNLKSDVPEKGIELFNDLPRYAMGYTSLFNSLSFTLETHMLKPFPERVKATEVFISGTIEWMKNSQKLIDHARQEAQKWENELSLYKYNYELTNDADSILFKGFEYDYIKSNVTGLKRLKYYEDKPYEKYVPFYRSFQALDSVMVPEYFVVGGQCKDVIEKLSANKVEFKMISEPKQIRLNSQRIVSFESPEVPYEGHFLHSNVAYQTKKENVSLKQGDVIVPTNQKNKRFILSVLTPDAPDSYFVWNSFDSYLQQKEYFSPYVFEEKAEEILLKNPKLKKEFELKKETDLEFNNSEWSQLYFIYKNSEFFEPTYFLLPVYSF
jgi:hypothetical protein